MSTTVQQTPRTGDPQPSDPCRWCFRDDCEQRAEHAGYDRGSEYTYWRDAVRPVVAR